MQVKLNGQPHAVGPETTIVDLLKQADVPDSYLAVEINLDVVPREMHATQTLNEGDEIEVVTLVGGG